MKAFPKSIFKITFSFDWGFLSNTGKHVRPIQRPFWCLLLLVDFRSLLDVIRRHGIRHILRTTGGNYGLQRQDEVFHRAVLAQLVSHQRSTVEVRKISFPSRNIFTRFVKALRKFSPVCPFDLAVTLFETWGELTSIPALESLGEHMRAL